MGAVMGRVNIIIENNTVIGDIHGHYTAVNDGKHVRSYNPCGQVTDDLGELERFAGVFFIPGHLVKKRKLERILAIVPVIVQVLTTPIIPRVF